MNIKKLLALLLSVVMMFSLFACSDLGNDDDDDSGSSKKSKAEAKIEEYVEKEGDEVLADLESSFTGTSGLTCRSTIKADGLGIVIRININELDNVPQETKDAMQDAYDDNIETFEEALGMLQEELPEVEKLTIYVCDKDGEELAKIVAKD